MEDNIVKVTTAYNVEIEYHTANVWDRVIAFIIDWLIKIGYLLLIFGVLLGGLGISNGWVIGAFSLPYLVYTLVFELFNEGKTPGKALMKVQVVSLTGRNMTSGQIITRWFARMIDFSLFTPGIAFLSSVSSMKGQRVGDVLANTTVITLKEREVNRSRFSRVKIPKGYVGKYRQVLSLKDHEVELIKHTIYNDTPAKHAIQLAAADRLMDFTGIPKLIPARKYLKMIVYDYNYFQRLDARSEEE